MDDVKKSRPQADQNDEFCEDVWTYRGYHLDKGNFTTAMVHLYRAEIQRSNLWRSRLDTTTNWAVVTVAAALTFSFSSSQNPHFVLLLVLMLVLTFLFIEARRFRYYGLWYHRARVLETNFFATMIAPPFHPPDNWGADLDASLRDPRFLIPRWRALGSRLKSVYIWMVSLLFLSWWLKLAVHPTLASDWQMMVNRAAIGIFVPGRWVIAAVIAVYAVLLGLMIASMAVKSEMGDESAQPTEYHRETDAKPAEFREELAIIITNNKEVLAHRLMEELGRGVTALQGIGMYTGEPRDVLLCAYTADQVQRMNTIVHETDTTAFVIVTQAQDMRGRGFTPSEPPE